MVTDFVLPGYLEMLNELARQVDQSELTKAEEKERPALLQQALQDEHALLILDNLETLPAGDRDRLFEFLSRLPRGCKAIVTSRRRADVDARILRLARLDTTAALALIADLALDRPVLARATDPERLALYENTGGNPLLIRWLAGQLGRGHCRTMHDALALLRGAPTDNDPLQFIFGDLADSLTETETKALAALSHFSQPVEAKFTAELSGSFAAAAAQTALEDLTGRALVSGDAEARRFMLMPLVADFLRRARPEAVRTAGDQLAELAYELAMENGYNKHESFPALEANWPVVSAALPLILQGPNERLQTVCDALRFFLEFTGRWDERLALNLQAERKAVEANDFVNAGRRAFQAGYVHNLRHHAHEVLACAERAAAHWHKANAGAREQAYAVRLRGIGIELGKDYLGAITAYREALELHRSLSPESEDVAIVLNDLADAERASGDFDSAEPHYREALRIAKVFGHREGIASITGNLAKLLLDRKDWVATESLAGEALTLSQLLGRKELIAHDCTCLAKALASQDRKGEALPYGERAVDIYTELRSPELDWALGVLRECQS